MEWIPSIDGVDWKLVGWKVEKKIWLLLGQRAREHDQLGGRQYGLLLRRVAAVALETLL